MKKFCISLSIIIIIILTVVVTEKPAEQEFLRIHIRANSDSLADQSVKYDIKNKVVEYLTPFLAECKSKEQAKFVLENNLSGITAEAKKVLLAQNFSYGANTYLCREEFPLRVYDGFTLDKGVYDTLIVELGDASGNNWWCVVYPPLCFTGDGTGAVKYKSKILEIIKDFKEKHA